MADQWLEVSVETTEAQLDTVVAKLTMNGINGLSIEDEADFKLFLEENRQYWDYVDDQLMARMAGVTRVKFYVTDDDHGHQQLKEWMTGIDAPYTTAKLLENDWTTSWQKYYRPMAVGDKTYIVPEWERGEPVPDGRTALYMNPGLIFGTGSHASTRLCLEGVERYVKQDDAVLDLGCGSGILSISALLFGAKSALGVDIDPKAVNVAYENAELNGIGRDTYEVLAGNVLGDAVLQKRLSDAKYDVLLVNIVADVIIALAPSAKGWMKPDATFICSGVIDTRADEVGEALEANGLHIVERLERDGWVSFVAGLGAPFGGAVSEAD